MIRSEEYLISLLSELRKLPKETGWVEFKGNNKDPRKIGQYISALSNTAALFGKSHAYMVWGVEDETHKIVGTVFRPSEVKVGNEELENWLLRLLNPRINFAFHELQTENGRVVVLEVERAINTPVRFDGMEYIRIGSYKKPLKDFPEKERELWRIFDQVPFEKMIALDSVPEDQVLSYFDYPSYFELLNIPLPENRKSILERLAEDQMIVRSNSGVWNITNLGAILFAKNLSKFPNLRTFGEMERKEKIHACYLHACLKYVSREYTTNASLRQRFGLENKDNSVVSRIIKDAVEAGKIKPLDPQAAPRYMKYIPFWA